MNLIKFRVRMNVLEDVLKNMGILGYFHFDILLDELDSCLLGVETIGGPRANPDLARVLLSFDGIQPVKD